MSFQINTHSNFLDDLILIKGYHWFRLQISLNHIPQVFTEKQIIGHDSQEYRSD